jgi:6,7-dimethyl-8-ribityllumazine synthase
MATVNLSEYNMTSMPDASGMRIGIVVSEWNNDITEVMYKGAYDVLTKHGVKKNDIIKEYVPGTFELTYGAKRIAEYGKVDAIIVIGCVIQGETRHFDFICQGVSMGITRLNIKFNVPIIFGVLTTDNKQQAIDRAGGKHGNKGVEAAMAAIKMAAFNRRNT